ncbi:MAG TPA: hypothetical protein DCQ67_01390 [Acidimicrobiaceae bacterium]|jgi:hypothetical protein|nr:hypothetical protein [Acidimicrobiaceae bacterium]
MKNNFASVQPPDPSKETIWTNPNSGITYTWNDSIKAWDAVSATQVAQTTETLPLANPSRFQPTGSMPDSSGLSTQKDLNEWIYECLEKQDVSALESRIETLEDQIEVLTSLVPPVDYGNVEITGGNDYNENQCWLAPNEEGMFICILDGSSTHGCRYNWELMRGEGRFSGPTNAQTVILLNQSSAPSTVVLRCTVSHPSTEATVHGEINILVRDAD